MAVDVVPVALGARSYEVRIGTGLIDRAGAEIAPLMKRKRAAVVTDETVAPLHLARLAQGAAALGFPYDPEQVLSRLAEAPKGQASRVRLTLGAAGDLDLTLAALPPAKPLWQLGVAQARLRSDDPWLGVKSTHRPAYDAARAALPAGLDEVIFMNERDEVCDGTITTVFFDRGQGLRTPPRHQEGQP